MTEAVATLRERAGLSVFELDVVRPLGVDAYVTTRDGGVSRAPYDTLNVALHVGDAPEDVATNRRLVAAASGVPIDNLITTEQVHGNHVTVVTNTHDRAVGDALLTTRDDVALMIMAADCLPLLVVDTATSTIGVIHAGWRGLEAGVLGRSMEHLSPNTTHVVLGPCISQAAYPVGDDVAQHFRHVDGAVVADATPEKWRLDLALVARHQLRLAGVPDAQVHGFAASTDTGQRFFSDRAQRPCGRFALVARRSPYHYAVKGHE